LGLLLYLRWRRLGIITVLTAIVVLWFISTPWTASFMAANTERYPPATLPNIRAQAAEAIVVLGGGSYRSAPEFNDYDDVSRLTLERLRYAVRLHRATGLDLAVTGGVPGGLATPEAFMMRTTLSADFKVPVRWLETASRNTAENAQFSREQFPFRTIVLVTHAMHMPRAVTAFEDAGFNVIPASMGYYSRPQAKYSYFDFLPSLMALDAFHYVIHEFYGALWYRWFSTR
jgi:uncharacterized SAM-binding protein YcdF (DUF218 family)